MADSSGFEQIGLQAILEDENFQAGVKRYDSGTSRMVEKTKSTSSALNSFGRVIETGIGVAIGTLTSSVIPKVIDGFGDFIKSASEAEKIERGLDAVLEATGGAAGVTKQAALDLAAGFSQLTTFEDDAVVAAESVLLRFKSINKETFPQATSLTLDLAQALGIDLSSAAKLLGKALEDPASGMGKLRVAGVNLTDEQEKLVKAMAESGNTAGAQKFIMDELAKSVGGAAQMAGQTAEGQWKIFQNQIGNLGETVGAIFLPVLTELVKTINKDILPAFQEWVSGAMPGIQKALTDFGVLIAASLPAIQKAFSAAWAVIHPILQGLADWFELLQSSSDDLTSSSQSTWGQIQKAVNAAWAVVGPIFTAIFEKLSTFWKEIQPKLVAAMSAIQIKIQDVWSFVWNSVIQPIVSSIAKFISDHWDEIQKVITTVMDFIRGYIDVVWSLITGIIKIALDLISGDFDSAAADWNAMMTGVMDGLKTMFNAAWEAIKSIFSLALTALVNAIAAQGAAISTAMQNTITGAITAIQNKYNDFVNEGAALVSKIVSGIQSAPSAIAGAIGAAIASATSLPQDVWNAVMGIGSAIIDNIVKGISDPFNEISQAISKLIEKAVSSAVSWLTGKDVNTSAPKDVLSNFASMHASQAAAVPSANGAIIYGASTVVNNYFNLTTNSLASAQNLASDFGIMRSLAGV